MRCYCSEYSFPYSRAPCLHAYRELYSKSEVRHHGQSQIIKDRKKGRGWDRALLQFSPMDNVMKKWNGWICALSSYNQVQGADRGQASASADAAERAQIELDHKGPNMHWGPRYCQHSCPIQWALKGKSYFKTEFTGYSCYSIGHGCEWPVIMKHNLHCVLHFVVMLRLQRENQSPVDPAHRATLMNEIKYIVTFIMSGTDYDVFC